MVDADDQGWVKCCTCDVFKPWKEMDAGHFIPQGSASILKFEPDNVHAQCRACNSFQGGRLMEYTFFIIRRYGMERAEWLKAQKFKTIKRHELEFYPMIEEFKALAKHEAQERGVKL